MYFVLADPGDEAAHWAAQGLRDRGLNPLEFITPAMLVRSPGWEHRVGTEGTRTSILLPGGQRLESHSAKGVLNRIPYLPVELFEGGRQEDRQYAQQEFTALLMSALSGLTCPVLNRPTAQGSGGSWRHRSEWIMFAARAGLATLPYRQRAGRPEMLAPRAAHTVFVAGGRAAGARAAAETREACVRLSEMARTALLGVEFTEDWTFANATPQPDLRLGGDAVLDLLRGALA